jgi:ATP-dependent Clp protease adaptor protein ClpS
MTVAPATPTKERPTRDSGGRTGDAWRVIVLNDNHNTFDSVAYALARTIPGVSVPSGKRIADRIHRSGQAIVFSGHLEIAELYWEQLRDAGLTMAPLERG